MLDGRSIPLCRWNAIAISEAPERGFVKKCNFVPDFLVLMDTHSLPEILYLDASFKSRVISAGSEARFARLFGGIRAGARQASPLIYFQIRRASGAKWAGRSFMRNSYSPQRRRRH